MVLHKDRPGKKSTEIVQGNLVLNPICHYQLFFRQKDITRGENNEIRCAFCSCLECWLHQNMKKKVRSFICGQSLFCTVKKPNRTQSKQIHVIFNCTICLCAASKSKMSSAWASNVKHEPLQSCFCTKQWLHQKHAKSFFFPNFPIKIRSLIFSCSQFACFLCVCLCFFSAYCMHKRKTKLCQSWKHTAQMWALGSLTETVKIIKNTVKHKNFLCFEHT